MGNIFKSLSFGLWFYPSETIFVENIIIVDYRYYIVINIHDDLKILLGHLTALWFNFTFYFYQFDLQSLCNKLFEKLKTSVKTDKIVKILKLN